MTRIKKISVNRLARKRNFKSIEEEGTVKQPCLSPKPERDILNEGLVNLYKKELDCKKEKFSGSQIAADAENKPKESGTDITKAPSKCGKRNKRTVVTPKHSSVKFDNIGGMDKVLKKTFRMLRHYTAFPLYRKNCISPVSGLLLHGPPGCGKTYFAHAIAGEIGIPILEVSATELVHGISGESESMIRDTFSAALSTGRCVLFIDEIDAICGKRETNENAMLRRMVNQIIKSFDELSEKDPDGNIIVIAATNMPDSLDNALRRGSRFTHEIAFEIPDENARLAILKKICKNSLSSDVDFSWLAHNTPGFVGADLHSLVSTAKMKALYRIDSSLPPDKNVGNELEFEELLDAQPVSEVAKWFHNYNDSEEEVVLTLRDFKGALKEIVPTSKREGFASVPDTTWDQIGSYEDIKEELKEAIMWPIEDNTFFEHNELLTSNGILLFGPKGCGKTLLAKAMANQFSINFLPVNGPELLNKYVGESEKAVRKVFERAHNSAPCIIFFDEFDALCPGRSSVKEHAVMESVVTQLLTEASGIRGRKKVSLIAATNRIDKIDSAMLRPGRFSKVLYVGLPTPSGRIEIIKSHLKRRTLEQGFDVEKIALDPRCEHFSGADISNLVHEASLKAVRELKSAGQKLQGDLVFCMRHFDQAFKRVRPSISRQEREYYEKENAKYTRQ